MGNLKNLWLHPKTTFGGLLIAVIAVGGALSQQGVSLGHVGTGTVVTMIVAVSSALLGVVAKDPSGKN